MIACGCWEEKIIGYKKKKGREKMGLLTVLELLPSASPVLPGCPCYPQPQVGSLVAASDLLLLKKRQECPGRLFLHVSRCVPRQNLCVQVVMEPRACLGLPIPLSAAQSHLLEEGRL